MDSVIEIVRRELVLLGFKRKAKSRFFKASEDVLFDLEIQSNSFNRLAHFINVEVALKDELWKPLGLSNGFAIWVRAESINQEKKTEYQACLDASLDMEYEHRSRCLQELFRIELARFLKNVSTLEEMLDLLRTGWGDQANVNQCLVALASEGRFSNGME